jgi:hypothetical protein
MSYSQNKICTVHMQIGKSHFFLSWFWKLCMSPLQSKV